MKNRIFNGVFALSFVLSMLLAGTGRVQASVPTPPPAPTQTPVPSDQTINPLTGLPVENPSLLGLSPILVSVSNFPVSVRPQSGLSFAPHVYEITIGDGETRFLAVYYGNYGPAETTETNLGSIRSGRLPYEPIRTMYDGLIVMAGAAQPVKTELNATVFRTKINFDGIEELAESRAKLRGSPKFQPGVFSTSVQPGGVKGTDLEIFWNRLNRVQWTYDAAKGKYLRAQDKADGKGTFYPATDKLTGEQLAFDNVVLLPVQHNYINKYIIEMDLMYIKKMPAIFFRDGQAYKVYWSTTAPIGPIKFFNEDGTPFPYKPGNTWFEVIQSIGETDQLASGNWMVDFTVHK